MLLRSSDGEHAQTRAGLGRTTMGRTQRGVGCVNLSWTQECATVPLKSACGLELGSGVHVPEQGSEGVSVCGLELSSGVRYRPGEVEKRTWAELGSVLPSQECPLTRAGIGSASLSRAQMGSACRPEPGSGVHDPVQGSEGDGVRRPKLSSGVCHCPKRACKLESARP